MGSSFGIELSAGAFGAGRNALQHGRNSADTGSALTAPTEQQTIENAAEPAAAVHANVHEVDRAEMYALVERARAGDRVAFAAIYDRYFQRIYKYALLRIGAPPADAEDIAAEVFVAAWQGLEKFVWMGAPFVSWLLTLAHRRAATLLRQRSRRKTDAVGDAGDLDILSPAKVGHEESGRDDVNLVQMMAQLPEEHRQVLALRFFGGMSAEEVGATMGKSANAVRQLQLKALERLRMQHRRIERERRERAA